jgi:polysaccharide export outer membrane protein
MSKQLIKILILLLIAETFFSSCKTQSNILFDNSINENSTAVIEIQKGKSILNSDEQIVKVGDALEIRNLKNEALISGVEGKLGGSTEKINQYYQVKKDSMVVLPVIGNTKLGGLSIGKATEMVNKLYEKSLLQNPIITLTIANQKVTLLGEFKQPGNFPLLKDQTHLIEMVGNAGGLLHEANKKRIKIIRGDLENPQILIVNLANVSSLSDKRLFLQNNDVIYAEPTQQAQRAENNGNKQSIVSIALAAVNILLVIYNIAK